MSEPEYILYCHCAHYDFLSRRKAQKLIAAITSAGTPSSIVPDLCRLCAAGDERLKEWARIPDLLIIACQPRAVRWLFHAGGVEFGQSQMTFLNARDETAVDQFLENWEPENTVNDPNLPTATSKDVPWFPVIDYGRCISCQKCQDFCLFGTFGLSEEGRVQVQQPDACKTDCPACARVCPENAIIFPKHHSAPINGGPVPPEDQQSGQSGVDTDELVEGDVYGELKNRGAEQRFSRNAPAELDLEAIQQKFGIPAEVMDRLSPDDINKARDHIQNNDNLLSRDSGEE